MKYATRKVVSAAAIAIGLALAAAAGPTSAGSMKSYEPSGPSAAVASWGPAPADPSHGNWNMGGGYYPGQGGDVAYDMETDGGVTISTPNGEVYPRNTKTRYDHGAPRRAAHYRVGY
jgi:hypothetical protein